MKFLSHDNPFSANHFNSTRAGAISFLFMVVSVLFIFKNLPKSITNKKSLNLSFKKITVKLLNCNFFRDVYEKGLLEKSPMTTVCENKEIIITQYNILKQSKPFWNDTYDIYSNI